LEESKPNNNLDCQQKSAKGEKLGEEEEDKRYNVVLYNVVLP
jgi:hypothetical protein